MNESESFSSGGLMTRLNLQSALLDELLTTSSLSQFGSQSTIGGRIYSQISSLALVLAACWSRRVLPILSLQV